VLRAAAQLSVGSATLPAGDGAFSTAVCVRFESHAPGEALIVHAAAHPAYSQRIEDGPDRSTLPPMACNAGGCSGYRSGGPVYVQQGGPGDPEPFVLPGEPMGAYDRLQPHSAGSANTGSSQWPAMPQSTRVGAALSVMRESDIRGTADQALPGNPRWYAGVDIPERFTTPPPSTRNDPDAPRAMPALLQFPDDAHSRRQDTPYGGQVVKTQTGGGGSVQRLRVEYEYDAYGHLVRVLNHDRPDEVFWEATAMDATGRVTGVDYGNGLSTSRTFNAVSGQIEELLTGFGNGASVQNLEYEWNHAGSLTQRRDRNQNLTESFHYDDLDRLETVHGPTPMAVTYDAIGNIASKTGIGTYQYDVNRPHQVISTSSGQTFAYDGNGNMIVRNGSSIEWTSYDMPAEINRGPNKSQFTYGPHRNRVRQVSIENGIAATTIYIGNALYERITSGGVISHRHYVKAGRETVAVHVRESNSTQHTSYLHGDHLGSVDVITDSTGEVLASLSFDAFGKRRGSDWTGAPTPVDREVIADTTRRGFTLHEHLDGVDLVHMNGRVYDPGIGRFLSADPLVPVPWNSQSFNRYSYVRNNPLTYTDPSGFREWTEIAWDPPCKFLCSMFSFISVDWYFQSRPPALLYATYVIGRYAPKDPPPPPPARATPVDPQEGGVPQAALWVHVQGAFVVADTTFAARAKIYRDMQSQLDAAGIDTVWFLVAAELNDFFARRRLFTAHGYMNALGIHLLEANQLVFRSVMSGDVELSGIELDFYLVNFEQREVEKYTLSTYGTSVPSYLWFPVNTAFGVLRFNLDPNVRQGVEFVERHFGEPFNYWDTAHRIALGEAMMSIHRHRRSP
jgi:RHS repeat-associated protein